MLPIASSQLDPSRLSNWCGSKRLKQCLSKYLQPLTWESCRVLDNVKIQNPRISIQTYGIRILGGGFWNLHFNNGIQLLNTISWYSDAHHSLACGLGWLAQNWGCEVGILPSSLQYSESPSASLSCSAPSSPSLWQRVLWGHVSEWDEGIPGCKGVSAYHLCPGPATPCLFCLLRGCTGKVARTAESCPGCFAVPELLLPGSVSEGLGTGPQPCPLPGPVLHVWSPWVGEALEKSPSLPPHSPAYGGFVPHFPFFTSCLPSWAPG